MRTCVAGNRGRGGCCNPLHHLSYHTTFTDSRFLADEMRQLCTDDPSGPLLLSHAITRARPPLSAEDDTETLSSEGKHAVLFPLCRWEARCSISTSNHIPCCYPNHVTMQSARNEIRTADREEQVTEVAAILTVPTDTPCPAYPREERDTLSFFPVLL